MRPPARTATALAAAVALSALAPWLVASRPRPSHPEVLVVVNANSPLSVATGQYYRTKRNVPAANVLALDIPLVDPSLGDAAQETVSRSRFDNEIRLPIESFLTTNGLVASIRVIVLTPGIPLRAGGSCSLSDPYYGRDCTRASVDAELAILFSSLVGAGGLGANGEAVNPYFGSTQRFADWRAANPGAPLRYLVARLAGYQTPVDATTGVPTDVKTLVDRATGDASGAGALIDEDGIASLGYQAGNLALLRPAASALGALGVPLQHNTSGVFVRDASNLGAYASWGSNDSNDPGPPYYGTINGSVFPGSFAGRAIATDIVSTNARSFVSPPSYGQSLLADLVRLGAAGAAGTVYEPLLLGVVRPGILLHDYFALPGAPAIEAYYRSVPYLGWMNVWIGDPLMTSATLYNPPADRDGDGVDDSTDNCIHLSNADQRDTDGDGYGNLCDPDVNNDGVVTTSWGVTIPPSARGDLERIQATASSGGYDAHHDLDGDGDVDDTDVNLASLFLFLPPGPSGGAP
jgi:uncharacterized protein (TIGR03790 family)